MVPEKLHIEGLYAYQKAQTIDFGPLLQGQLFGIFGATGSGKSSILEAIILALYGQSERLNQRDNRGYNMMNLRSQRLWVEFVFTAGPQNQRFCCTYEVKRNSRQFAEVRPPEHKAYRFEGPQGVQERMPVELGQVHEVLGLSYENFRRTIIIPQGKFSEFLQLGGADRTKMLKAIFNLDKYELAGQTQVLARQTEQSLNMLAGQLQSLEQVGPEQISTLEAACKELQAQVAQLKKAYTSANQALTQLQEAKNVHDSLQEALERLEVTAAEEEQYQQRRATLAAYNTAYQAFASLLAQQGSLQNKVATGQKALTATQQKGQSLQEQLAALGPQLQAATKALDQKEVLQAQAADFKTLAQIQGLEQELATVLQRINKGNTVVKQRQEQAQQQQQALEKLAAQLQAVNQKLPPNGAEVNAQQWLTLQQGYVKDQNSLEQAGQDLVQRQKATTQQALKRLQNWPPTAQTTATTVPQAIEQVQQSLASLQTQINTLQAQQEQQAVQSALAHMAAQLQEGQPCPLCGATEHPNPYVEAANNELAQQLAQQKSLQEQGQGLLQDLRQDANKLELLAEQHTQAQNKAAGLTATLQQHAQKWPWQHDPTVPVGQVAALEKAVNQALEWQKQAKELTELRHAQSVAVNQAGQDLTTAQKLLQDLKQKQVQFDSTINTLQQSLQQLTLQQATGQSAQQLTQKAQDLLGQIQQAQQNFQALDQQHQALQQQLSSAQGKLESQQSQQEALQAELAQVQTDVQTALDNSNFADLRQVQDLLAQQLNVPQEQQAIEQFFNSLTEVKGIVQNLQAKAAAQPYNAQQHQDAQAAYQQADGAYQQARRDHDLQQDALARMQRQWAQKQDLQQQQQQQQDRQENLKTLLNLFKGSGFVNYISSVYLQQLCAAANERFYQLTRKQLRLELDDKNNFVVRDFLNEGHPRSVKTLSGGQLFQASLSLALALAESIQRRHGLQQNFFFLDEGFGSQDAESLQLVFDTLKALRQENRYVGVISHVAALQQEIDVYLSVESTANQGSLINKSWQME